MSLKDIFVHLDTSAACERRVNAALMLAREHAAHLTGVAIVSRPYIPAYAEVEIGMEIIKERQQQMRDALEDVGAVFDEQAGQSGVTGEWRILEGEPSDILSEQARYSDLMVLSQDETANDILLGGQEIPERVILTSGRPARIVPRIYKDEQIGKHVLVGWDRGRMAARAVHDSLSVLQTAEKVTIMTANPTTNESGNGGISGADLAVHLARHGVSVEADHTVSEDLDIGDLLLSRAADLQADLIVLGAYGHARWRKLVLGGVTKHMLEHMPVPVLMSH